MIHMETIKHKVMRVLGRSVIFLVDTILWTCRIEVAGTAPVAPFLKKGPYLLASWHGRLVVYFFGPRKDKPAAMASRSRDGYMASLLQETGGYVVYRGSSRKGGAEALAQMGAYMKRHSRSGMLSVDGPTGPMFVAKPGVTHLASSLSYPIIPISFSARRVKIMKSWDRLMVPMPFSDCLLIYGRPIHTPPNPTEADVNRITHRVEDELRRITEIADKQYGHMFYTLR